MLKLKSLALAAALAGLCGSALAAPGVENYGGYLRASDGSVVRSGTGLCWHTGSWTPGTKDPACDAVVVADAGPIAAPQAAEAPSAALPPQMSERLELSGVVHFAFNSSRLTPRGKAILDDAIAKSRSGQVSVAMVTGYADRIDTETYNHALAGRRAQATADYLVSHGIDGSKVQIDERGESEPVKECHNRSRSALIACLAPNRRAEVVIRLTRDAR